MKRAISLICLLIFVVPMIGHAARLYLDPARDVLQAGDAVMLAVRLDIDQAEDVCINAADVILTYPDSLRAVDTSTRNSIFPLWIEPPTIDESRNRVTFAGGIPNGYCGRIEGDPGVTNVLAEVVFRSTTGQLYTDVSEMEIATIVFADSIALYVNDGFGTKLVPETHGADITLLPTVGPQIRDPWREIVQADLTPPEPFSIYLERDSALFDGDYFIVFNTTDKQSGLSHFEVMEEPLAEQQLFRFGQVGAPWVQARSPYRLRDQTLNSTIRVRAIDKAGNEYIATLVPDPALRTRVIQPLEWVLIGLGGGVLLVLGWILWNLNRRRPTLMEHDK